MTIKNLGYGLAAFAIIIGAAGAAYAQSIGVTLPSVPTGVTVSNPVPTQVSISWTASTESSGTIEGYYVYRNGAQIAVTAGTSMTDGGLTPGLYDYTVAAYDANGAVSSQSSPASITLIADTTPPTTPTGLTVSGSTTTNSYYTPVTLTISWNPSTDNIGVAGYDVYRNNTQVNSSTVALTGTSFTDTVYPGTYVYTVKAYDAAQNVSDPSAALTVNVTIDDTPPTTPTGIVLQQISATGVQISWSSSTDSDGIAGYQIFRNGTQIATTTASPYTDSDLSAGLNYSYTITAYDPAGNISTPSNPMSIMVQQVNGIETPYAVSPILTGTSTVTLSWAPVADPLAITGYGVYLNGTQIATVTSTNYIDTGLIPGTYYYGVTASDVSGAVSSMSATTTIVVPVPATTTAISPVIGPFAPITTAASPATASATGTATGTAGIISQTLYYGLRSAQVKTLQSILVAQGYLASVDATGFFGNLTLAAVKKFQCEENIVCTGGAGWGNVGPKTRAALNEFSGGTGGAASASAAAGASSNNASLAAQLQVLEAELTKLEEQAGGATQ